jgi:hypothetical protein
MAEKKKFTSSPSPMDLMAGAGANSTAFSSMSNAIISGMPANMYGATNPYLPYLNAPDATAKAIELQNLKRMLSSQAAPTGVKETNMFDYWQSLARATGFSKAKTPIGVIGPGDDSAMATIIGLAAANNADPIPYLQTLKNYGVGAKPGPKQIDTTTKYNKQVSTALQLKDITDARSDFNDAYFAAFGLAATKDLDDKFVTQWNNTAKEQKPTTTTNQTTSFAPLYDKKSKPVIDPKTKKQKIDKFGSPVFSKPLKNKEGIDQFRTINKTDTITSGEGFTAEEQEQFVADFLVKNFPNEKFTAENLGGAAKSIYDDLVGASTKNYATAPDFGTLAPVIKDILSTTDQNVAQEKIKQYKTTIRNQVAAKYMGIADYVNAGEDAEKYVKPLMQSLSNALERDVTEKDPILKQALNFKGDDGKYRLPNDWEMTKLIMSDAGYGKTSTAINESVNMFQSLKSKLGRE